LKELIDEYRVKGGSYLFVKEESDPAAIRRNFSVFVDEKTGNVRRVIEKPRYVQNNLKGCGLYLFELPIFDAVRRTPRTAMRDEYEITESIQILIDDGEPVHVAPVVEDDINLTFPHDILRCNLEELDRRGLDTLIDETAEISPQATIRRSVIGPNAKIEGSVTLEDCVVFEGATVKDHDHALSNLAITPDSVVDCRASLLANS
jgi:dTDP-glucose pyrophosphorylase